MKRNTSIQIKAAFMLIVFAMNTLVGFACAMGVDMGFNTKERHEEVTKVSIHVHADGKKHQHHHDVDKHQHDKKEATKKDGCCNDKVIKFQDLDKAISQNIKTPIASPIFAAIISNFFGIDIFKPSLVSSQKYIVRFFHPPPSDIRVLIRSFKI